MPGGNSQLKTLNIHSSIVDQSEMSATPTEFMMMKKAKAVKYTFFPKVFDDHEKMMIFVLLIHLYLLM